MRVASRILRRTLRAGIVALVAALGADLSVASAHVRAPLQISRQGWLYAGGRIEPDQAGQPMVGQMYVEYQIPARQTHPFPVVMIHGNLQSGANFTGTPDGREGWAQYFLRRGYAVYVVDQPGRGRSAYNAALGAQTPPTEKATEDRFTAPEKARLWPQAQLHTQWQGRGVPGDPSFDAFYASELPSVSSVAAMQALVRDASAALLDRIGPAIVLVHSQAGLYPWSIAQARPGLVRAIVAVEPSGPPVHDIQDIGPPDWFRDDPKTKPSGLGELPLQYDPPLEAGEELVFERAGTAAGPGLARCWAQREPARKLAALGALPILMITAEASYHAPFDDCTAAYLRQGGVRSLDHIHLAAMGIHGNGHMMMLEKNSDDIAKVIVDWLNRQPWNAAPAVLRRDSARR